LYGSRPAAKHGVQAVREPPILITGAGGSLGGALARACEERGFQVRATTRSELDIANRRDLEEALSELRPWLVINAARYARLHEAEVEYEACHRANVVGPALLAEACRRHDARLVVFSSALVFDGRKTEEYVEDDVVAPINVYGATQARSEKQVLTSLPGALVVRTGALFGPLEGRSFVARALEVIGQGSTFRAPDDCFVSPAYLPHLAHACLDLAIDHAEGVWHLANDDVLSLASWAKLMCEAAGLPASAVHPCPASALLLRATLPRQGGLRSNRRGTLPKLSEAIAHFAEHHRSAAPPG
jgi:dTDP-4-dehydrorhamnose reductase